MSSESQLFRINGIKKSFIFPVYIFLCLPLTSESQSLFLSRYVYQLNLEGGKNVYIFGSSHMATANIPLRLSQCVKDIFLEADKVYIEADQLAVISYFGMHHNMQKMSAISEYIGVDTLSFLVNGLFGKESANGIARLINMDAQMVLNALIVRIPGSAKLLGQTDLGLDAELVMAARFLNKDIDYIEKPEDQLLSILSISPKVYASAISTIVELHKDESAANLYLKKISQLRLLLRMVMSQVLFLE